MTNPPEPDRTSEPQAVTAQAVAAHMKLPQKVLPKRGVRTSDPGSGTPHLVIPYKNRRGKDIGNQYRWKFNKDDEPKDQPRFTFDKGFNPQTYGEERLKGYASRKGMYKNLNVFEGTSDVWAIDAIELASIAFASAAVFDLAALESIDEQFPSFETYTVCIEEDLGGESVMRKVEAQIQDSPIKDKIRFLTSRHMVYKGKPCNDVREFREVAPNSFKKRFEEALEKTTTWQQYEDGKKAVLQRAFESIEQSDGVSSYIDAIHKTGIVGEDLNLRVAVLCAFSILSKEPVNPLMKGASGSGKSTLLKRALQLIPNDRWVFRTSFSPLALVYSEEDFEHRIIFLNEYDGMAHDKMAENCVKSIITEYMLDHETVINHKPKHLHKDGPIGFWTTTTDTLIEHQVETRMFTSFVDSSPEQTEEIIKMKTKMREQGEEAFYVDPDPYQAKFEYIATVMPKVKIPWMNRLQHLMPEIRSEERVRRDWDKAMTLIEADARINHTRLRRDDDGYYIADASTYMHVKPVLEQIFNYALSRPPKSVIQTVETINRILDDPDGEGFPQARKKIGFGGESDTVELTFDMVAQKLGNSKGNTNGKVKQAIAMGFVQNLEKSPGVRARLVRGDRVLRHTSSEENPLMPDVTELFPEGSVVLLGSGAAVELLEDDDYGYPIVSKEQLPGIPPLGCLTCGGKKFWNNPRTTSGWTCNTCSPALFKTDMVVGTTEKGDFLLERQ